MNFNIASGSAEVSHSSSVIVYPSLSPGVSVRRLGSPTSVEVARKEPRPAGRAPVAFTTLDDIPLSLRYNHPHYRPASPCSHPDDPLMHSLPLRLAAGLLVAALPMLTLLLPRDAATSVADEKKPAAKFTLKKGDRIGIIGNTLADRMQHDGWLEAYLHSRSPNHDLAFRHLGFSGDELTLRLRSASFGSPDTWLTRTQADVVFAFFGYNESFKDKAGLDDFKKDLTDFINKALAKKYNGKSAPRLVLFSPIAHEDLKDANLP